MYKENYAKRAMQLTNLWEKVSVDYILQNTNKFVDHVISVWKSFYEKS